MHARGRLDSWDSPPARRAARGWAPPDHRGPAGEVRRLGLRLLILRCLFRAPRSCGPPTSVE
eukprot:9476830-Pyramimonas_sp.AAC.1